MFRSTIRFLSLGIVAAVLSAPVAEGCSCVDQPTAVLREQADLVFYGTVLSREDLPTQYSDDGVDQWADVRYELLVEGGWKGARADTVVIYTSSQEPACGYPFEVGRKYLVFSNVDPKHDEIGGVSFPPLGTSRCSGTKSLERAEERVTALGEPTWGPKPTGFVVPPPPVYRSLPIRDR